MNKRVLGAILALPLFTSLPAHAFQSRDSHGFYAGLATGQSKSTLENSAGERFSSKNHPLPIKLYGGVELSDYLALEAGFTGATGKHEFDKGLYGTATEPRLASRVFYAAVKGTVAVSDRVDLHAKLGAAHSRFEFKNAGVHNGSLSGTRPMFGVGAAYKLTESVAATLEFEHYGTVSEKNSRLSKRQLQAGLKFSF